MTSRENRIPATAADFESLQMAMNDGVVFRLRHKFLISSVQDF